MSQLASDPEIDDLPDDVEPLPFWRLEEHAALAPVAITQISGPAADDAPKETPPPAEHLPLTTWRVLGPRLRQRAATRVDGRALDFKKIIQRLSSGTRLDRLPRKQRLSWGHALHVIRDRSLRLVPYWRDQDLVLHWLRRLLPEGAVPTADYFDGLEQPVFEDSTDYDLPAPGTLVVMLGDLGCLAKDATSLQRYWFEFAGALADVECRAIALSPAPASQCSEDLKHVWELIPWESLKTANGKSDRLRSRQAERLLSLVSPAVRSRLWHAAHQNEPDPEPPPGFVPGAIPSDEDDEPRNYSLIHQGGSLRFLHQPESVPSTISALGLLGRLSSRNRDIKIEALSFWRDLEPPIWAASWGTDACGCWVTFELDRAEGEPLNQRLRWIPPGTFMMGSPGNEPEREDIEGRSMSSESARAFGCLTRLAARIYGRR